MHPQKACGNFVIAPGLLPRLNNRAALGIVNAAMKGRGCVCGRSRSFQDRVGKIFELDFRQIPEHNSALDGILEFANVAWPIVASECRQGGRGEATNAAACGGSGARKKSGG